MSAEPTPGLRHYHSPQGLFAFQGEDVALAYLRPVNYALWDCGTGKTHLAMATAALLFEDDLIDLVVVVCEKNRADRYEWPKDFADFTDLTTVRYVGTPERRAKIRADLPQVLIGVYETMRNDLCEMTTLKRGAKTIHRRDDGPLMTALRGRRILFVYDEPAAKLKNRTSELYKAHEYMIRQLRKDDPELRILYLTATEADKGPVDTFNTMRIFAPKLVPTVERFETDYVKSYDLFGNPARYKNLTRATLDDPAVVPFSERLAPILMRRRKTDPELIEHFPKRLEEWVYIEMGEHQASFYETVQATFDPERVFVTLRMIAGDPRSVLLGKGQIAREIVEQVGEDGLRAIGSAKSDRLRAHLGLIAKGQGSQVVVFSFFTSVLAFLHEDLLDEGYEISLHHGGLDEKARTQAKEAFKAGDTQIFLTSDAGSRGLNLPGALYTISAEMPFTASMNTQRQDRNHRIDSTFPSVTHFNLVMTNTVEEGIEVLGYRRGEWADQIIGDEDEAGEHFLSTAQRRILARISRHAQIGRQ